VRARDALGGETFDVRARWVVNCAGPDAWRLLRRPGGITVPAPPLSRAVNLVLRRSLGLPSALGLRLRGFAGTKGEQILFAAPWRERTLLGTFHLPLLPGDDPPRARLRERELDELLSALNRVHPALGLAPDDVALVHGGVQAVAGWDAKSGQVRHAPDAIVLDHAHHGAPGLLSLVGVKFTEACGAARRLVDRVVERGGRGGPSPAGGGAALPGGEMQDEPAACAELAERTPGLSERSCAHLVASYGGRARAVAALASAPGLAAAVAPGARVVGAEVVHAIREEMASTLCDVVLRRTELGALGELDADAIARCGELAAAELGWSAERRQAEEDALRAAVQSRLEPPR
jgi:glycerol-3-phosphate dehydrogenase